MVVETRGGASGTIAADLVAKAGTPGEIVASSPADLGAWVREQTASRAKVARAANIKPE